jgi:hypothetical protein
VEVVVLQIYQLLVKVEQVEMEVPVEVELEVLHLQRTVVQEIHHLYLLLKEIEVEIILVLLPITLHQEVVEQEPLVLINQVVFVV